MYVLILFFYRNLLKHKLFVTQVEWFWQKPADKRTYYAGNLLILEAASQKSGADG